MYGFLLKVKGIGTGNHFLLNNLYHVRHENQTLTLLSMTFYLVTLFVRIYSASLISCSSLVKAISQRYWVRFRTLLHSCSLTSYLLNLTRKTLTKHLPPSEPITKTQYSPVQSVYCCNQRDFDSFYPIEFVRTRDQPRRQVRTHITTSSEIYGGLAVP